MEIYNWDFFAPYINEHLRNEIAKKLKTVEKALTDIYCHSVDHDFWRLFLPHYYAISKEIEEIYKKLVNGGKP